MFSFSLEPTYITIGPPTCPPLVNCTLKETDCIYDFKVDQNGCRICQCKTSKYKYYVQLSCLKKIFLNFILMFFLKIQLAHAKYWCFLLENPVFHFIK